MTRRIDVRLLVSATAILTLAVAWLVIWLFRRVLPAIAADTIWGELTGPTSAALVVLGIEMPLCREKVFYPLAIADVPGMRRVHLFLLRRDRRLGSCSCPTSRARR